MNICRTFVLALITVAGCSGAKEAALPKAFTPPGIQSLQEVDVADVEYEDVPIVVEGLVSVDNQAASVGDAKGFDVHMFELAAWKEPEGPLVEKKLLILRPIAQEHDWTTDFPTYSTHRFKLLMSKERNRSVFISSEPIGAATEFQAIVARLQTPVIIEDERLGELILNRSLNWFEGEANWNGEVVSVSIETDEKGTISHAKPTVEELWENQSVWQKRLLGHAVKELLDLKNGTWLRDGETKFSDQQFTDRMELESIHINADGTYRFWFDDGGLFWGHAITVSGDTKNGPDDAGLHG